MAKFRRHLHSCFAALLVGFANLLPVSAAEVDLELVLAMDGSGSISEPEYILQIEGTAAAFADPAIQQAILSGPTGRIAVSVLIWADAALPKFESGWYVIDSVASANHFAAVVLNFHQHSGRRFGKGGGGTGIGEGIRYALEMMRNNKHSGLRQVIDVSGDGVETDPWFKNAVELPLARTMAKAQKATVNGLAILTRDFPRLDQYFREQVISGPGAFVVVADGFEDFGRAIREKLWREISQQVARGGDNEVLSQMAALHPQRQLKDD